MGRRFTAEQAGDIRLRAANGERQADLAREFRVGFSCVNKIVLGHSYGEPRPKGPKPREFDPEGRVCTKCGQFRVWSDFSPLRKGLNGHRANCKGCVNANGSTAEDRRKQADQRLRRKYKITLKEFERVWKLQGGACALCGRPERYMRRGAILRPHVDHDHACCPGEVTCGKCLRGLLCSKCNRLVGRIEAAGFTLAQLADYQQQRLFPYLAA